MMRKQVDGVIIASQTEANIIQNFKKRNIPVVLLNNCLELHDLCCVVSDDYGGTFEAVEYLISRGHKKIGLLAGRFSTFIYSRRYNAYIDALKKHGLSPDFRFVHTVGPTIKEAFDCTISMLLLKDLPTAFFCTNDAIAAGVLKAVLRSGLKVPEDVSIIGYDDSDFCRVMEPELTSVYTDKERMGCLTVEFLNMQINGQLPKEKVITVGTKLIVRQSTN
jgi:DNA-binding LacI/PurR family transcriptional regulator